MQTEIAAADVKTVQQNSEAQADPVVIPSQVSAALVSVVVLKGKSVWYNGDVFTENTVISLSESEAKRLITLGFVQTV